MFCAISGTIPSEPVVSKKSGHIYEKRLILKALETNDGKCPQTNQFLDQADLIPLISGGPTSALPPGKNTVPDMLKHIQNEWDATVLELNRVKTTLHETRQELATVMYRYEAANNQIVELQAKNDLPARKRTRVDDIPSLDEHLSNSVAKDKIVEEPSSNVTVPESENNNAEGDKTNSEPSQSNGHTKKEEDRTGETFSTSLMETIKTKATELRAWRKNRKQPKDLNSSDTVSKFRETQKTLIEEGSGISSIVPRDDGSTLLGSRSGQVYIFDIASMKMKKSVEAHSEDGGTSAIAWSEERPSLFLTGGADGIVKLWDVETMKAKLQSTNKGKVVSAHWHPIQEPLSFICRTKRYEWRDMERNITLSESTILNEELTTSSIHPDGMIFSAGNANGEIKMWDITSMKQVATLSDELTGKGKVSSIQMSEKGYYMISCQSNIVSLWDLRSRKVTGSLRVGNHEDQVGNSVNAVLDKSGEYGCVVGADQISIFQGKKKAKRITDISLNWTNGDYKGDLLGAAWGEKATELLVGSATGYVYKLAVLKEDNT